MRRVLTILGRIGVIVSLLLCLLSVYLWARSYLRPQGRMRTGYPVQFSEYRFQRIDLDRGRMQLNFWRVKLDPGVAAETRLMYQRGTLGLQDGWWLDQPFTWQPSARHWWEWLGAYVRWEKNVRSNVAPGFGSSLFVSLPAWLPFTLTAIAPVLWAVKWWRKRVRSRIGLCRKCGYDLRASPEKCPECGAPVGFAVRTSSVGTGNNAT
jgi:hypothetical protein